MNTSKQFSLVLQKKKGNICISGIPKTNQYQTIDKLVFSPRPIIVKESKWKNEIAVFTLDDVKDNIKISFRHQSKKISQTINSLLLLKNYPSKVISDRFINGKDINIVGLTKRIIKSENRIGIVAKTLYNFSLEYLTYGKPIEGLHPYSQALKEKMTDCGGFSTFLLSLFQSVGIPGRLVVGFIIKDNVVSKILSTFDFGLWTFDSLLIHAWLEIQLPDNSWFPMDPSVEWRRNHSQSKRQGGFGLIPNDRLVVSVGEDFKIKIDNKIYQTDIFQHPIYL